jgi:hypothetical protein
MNSNNVIGILIVLFCALAGRAEALRVKIVDLIGNHAPLWSQIIWTTAAVIFLVLVVVHELSAVLALCPLAAPIRSQKSAAPSPSNERGLSASRNAVTHPSAKLSQL